MSKTTIFSWYHYIIYLLEKCNLALLSVYSHHITFLKLFWLFHLDVQIYSSNSIIFLSVLLHLFWHTSLPPAPPAAWNFYLTSLGILNPIPSRVLYLFSGHLTGFLSPFMVFTKFICPLVADGYQQFALPHLSRLLHSSLWFQS